MANVKAETLADRVGFLVDRGYGQVMFSFHDEFTEYRGDIKPNIQGKLKDASDRYDKAVEQMFDALADMMNLVGATSTLRIEDDHGTEAKAAD